MMRRICTTAVAMLSALWAMAQQIDYKIENNRMVADITVNEKHQAHAYVDPSAAFHIIDSTYLAKSGLQLGTRPMRAKLPFLTKGCEQVSASHMLRMPLTINGMQTNRVVYVADLSRLAHALKVKQMDMLVGFGLTATDGSKTLTMLKDEKRLVWGKAEEQDIIGDKANIVMDNRFLIIEGKVNITDAINDITSLEGRYLLDPNTAESLILYGGNKAVSDVLNKSDIRFRVFERDKKPITYIPKATLSTLGTSATYTDVFIYPEQAIPFIGIIGREWIAKGNLVLNFDDMTAGVKR